MMIAAKGGLAEIEMARVALQKSSNDAVRKFAQKMIDDHTMAGDKLKQLASMKGVMLPMQPDAKQMAMADDERRHNFHPSPLVANRHLRDVLIAKGYQVKYQEFAGHHSPVNLRGTFPDALIFCWPTNRRSRMGAARTDHLSN